MGRAFIKNILNSAHGLKKDDNSTQALQARCIAGLHELDGIEFVAKVGMDKDQYDEPKNIIQVAVTPDNKDYAGVMGQRQGHVQQQAQQSQANVQPATPQSGRPAWAE